MYAGITCLLMWCQHHGQFLKLTPLVSVVQLSSVPVFSLQLCFCNTFFFFFWLCLTFQYSLRASGVLCVSGSILKPHGVNTDKQWYPIKMLSGMDLLAVSYCEVLVLVFFIFLSLRLRSVMPEPARGIVFKSGPWEWLQNVTICNHW